MACTGSAEPHATGDRLTARIGMPGASGARFERDALRAHLPVPTWTPSPNIRTNPNRIHTTVARENNGTNKKNAAAVPRNRTPKDARRKRMIINLLKAGGMPY